jgi:tripartite-type tricarboxylate transporter receptor subunit TctC
VNRREYLVGMGLLPLASARAAADTYPSRVITIANGYPPGGSTDVSARLMGDAISSHVTGAKTVIETRAGASGTVASEWLRRQPADGYTLMLSESSSFAIWPSMHVSGTRYNPLADFTWISTVCTAPMVLIVSPDFPAKTLPEALQVLRSPHSEELSYSSSGAGSIPHIGAELLRSTLGAKSQHVPYRGGAPAVLSIGKNETAWGVASLGSAAGLITGGMVRPLAVTSPTRFPSFPDIPTFTEAGMPEMELNIYYLLHAPAGVSPAIIETLNRACVAGLKQPGLREKFQVAGMQAWEGANTPEATRKVVEDELKRFKLVSERTGIKILGSG